MTTFHLLMVGRDQLEIEVLDGILQGSLQLGHSTDHGILDVRPWRAFKGRAFKGSGRQL